MSLLTVTDLQTRFKVRNRLVHAVNGVSFSLEEGETLGVVGESGCGKSVTFLSLLRLLPPAARIVAGRALFQGNDLLAMSKGAMQRVRGAGISMVFQDPMTSLNPVVNIGTQISEPLVYHRSMSKEQAWQKSAELLDMVGVPDSLARLKEHAHQLSGGMRQRVMIAIALACQPRLLIADEPTTALDVTVQAQLVDLIKRLRDQQRMSVVWITHDLSVIAGVADRVLVMYAGTIVEEATVDSLFECARHPYTMGLMAALPRVDGQRQERLHSIPGSPPDLTAPLHSCPFAPRCGFAVARCQTDLPALAPVPGQSEQRHLVACWVDTRGAE